MEGRYYEYWINGIIEDNTDKAGIFHVLADSNEEKVLKFSFAFIHTSRISEFDINAEGENLNSKIETIMLNMNEHESNYNFVNNINNNFEDFFNAEKIKKVFEIITASRDPFLKNVLVKDSMEEIFRKLYKKANLKIEVKYSLVNAEENIMDLVEEKETVDSSPKKKNLIKIKTNPVLDPIQGIPVNKLKLGDDVFVKVTDNNIDFSSMEDILHKDNDDFTKKVFKGKVTAINKMEDSGSIHLSLKLGNLYVGDTVLQEELKVQAIQNAHSESQNLSDNEFDDFSDDEEDDEKMPFYFYVIIGVVSLMIFATLYFLFS